MASGPTSQPSQPAVKLNSRSDHMTINQGRGRVEDCNLHVPSVSLVTNDIKVGSYLGSPAKSYKGQCQAVSPWAEVLEAFEVAAAAVYWSHGDLGTKTMK